jgi:anti-anti-sigma factor
MLEFNITSQNGHVPVTILRPVGEIDSSNYKSFQTVGDDIISNGARHLLLDMADAPYISSAGLRVIHTLFNKLRSLHQDANDDELRKKMSAGSYRSPFLKVVNLQPQVKEAFELSGFDVYIEVCDDLTIAVQSFQ